MRMTRPLLRTFARNIGEIRHPTLDNAHEEFNLFGRAPMRRHAHSVQEVAARIARTREAKQRRLIARLGAARGQRLERQTLAERDCFDAA